MGHRLPDAQRQPVVLREPLEDPGSAEPAVLVVHGDDPSRVRDAHALAGRVHPLVLGHRAETGPEAPGRLLPENPGRVARAVAFDDAAVESREPRAENLIRALKVMQIPASELPTRVARARRVERRRIATVARVADPEVAIAGEQPTVTRVPGRQHAIEHINARQDGFDQVLGCPDTHEIPRRQRRQPRRGMSEDPQHFLLRLANRQSADCIAIESDVDEPRNRCVAQVAVHAALDNAVERVRIVAVGDLRSLRPA